ncbi:protein LMBR1L isoform X1 [Myiozetetes cayanensis]|uniref:protein LMBR1L isoform X1 n=1 Tax=Myiozetetes cayanensis TaxID=478635 RepID=UPI0021608BE1|nr:protein LMBR1L isoform X1 [Myiozetetes cayanensis]
MAPLEQDALAVREQLFHERVRECIICALLFASLYILCHFIITHFKKHTDFTAVHDDEDAAVNRIALGLCTFTLAVALGAVLLLPFSIISNEVLLSFPHNYYIQWLSGSLVHGLWNLVFLFSNLSLVFLMPFAYFFTESEGFAGSKKLLEDLDEQLSCTRFEEAAVSRRIRSGKASCWLNLDVELLQEQFFAIRSKRLKLELRHRASPWQRNLGYPLAMLGLLALTGISVLIVCFHVLELLLDDAAMPRGIQDASLGQVSFSIFGSFGAALQVVLILYPSDRLLCPQRRPFCPQHSPQGHPTPVFLLNTPHSYLMVSSVVGFYSSPLFTRLLPERRDTPLTKIIGNCVSLLVLSSALPVFSRTLGITRFDLLGDFGRFNWLGNFYIVFLYNMGFAGLTTLCLVKRVSWAVQAELIRAFGLHKLPLPVTCRRPLVKSC